MKKSLFKSEVRLWDSITVRRARLALKRGGYDVTEKDSEWVKATIPGEDVVIFWALAKGKGGPWIVRYRKGLFIERETDEKKEGR